MSKTSSLLLCLFLLLAGCDSSRGKNNADGSPAEPEDTVAVYYYSLRTRGRFTEYVEAMQSCRNTTPDYKQGMVHMLKQHQKEQEKAGRRVDRVRVVRKEMHNHNRMANVFLDIAYTDSTHEEILFPLVYDDGQWLIQ